MSGLLPSLFSRSDRKPCREVKHEPFLYIDEREHGADVDFSRTLIGTFMVTSSFPFVRDSRWHLVHGGVG